MLLVIHLTFDLFDSRAPSMWDRRQLSTSMKEEKKYVEKKMTVHRICSV